MRWLLSTVVIQWLSVFKNMSLHSSRTEALSWSSEGQGRNFLTYFLTEIRPLHWEVTRHEHCWMMKYEALSHSAQGGTTQAGGSHSFPKMYALALLFWGQWRHIFQRRHCQCLTQINFVNIISSSAALVVSQCPCMPSGTYWEHNLVQQRSHTARHTSISNEFLFYDLIIFQQNPHARVDIQPSKAQTKGGA